MFVQIVILFIFLVVISMIVLIAWKGKDLLKMQALQGSFFKQASFLVSSPQNVQKNLFLSETGSISMPLMPVNLGFETAEQSKRQWAVIHSLKFLVFKDGKPFEDDSVLLISEKCYQPQDPNECLTKKEGYKLAALNEVAKTTHMVLRAEAQKAKDQIDILNTIIYGSFLLDGLFGIIYLIHAKTGG